MPPTPAEKTVSLIENRAAHILSKLHTAAALILRQAGESVEAARPPLSAAYLEAYTEHWRFLLPDDPAERAAVLHLMAERWAFDRDSAPETCASLGVDAPALRSAYESAYGQPPDAALRPPHADSSPAMDPLYAAVIGGLRWRYLLRGETLIQAGDAGTGLYLLLEGLVRVQHEDAQSGALHVIATLGPGELIGEMSLLTGEAHGATVIGLRDSDLVLLSRTAFDQLTEAHPILLRSLAYQAIERLRGTTAERQALRRTRLVALLYADPALAESFTPQLQAAFDPFGAPIKRLTAPEVDAGVKENNGFALEELADDYAFVDWLEQQALTFPTLLCDSHPDYPNWTRRIILQADHILIVARADGDADLSVVERILAALDQPELTPPQSLVLVQPRRDMQPQGTRRWLEKRPRVAQHHHVALDHKPDLARLVRAVRGRSVGIVFGGGGMRGAAHAGVIQALEELDVAVDYVGGTSAGAVVAAQYGLEWDVPRIMEETRERLLKRSTLFQFTLPFVAFTTAQKLNAAYAAMFGGVDIEDLWRPAFTIASNLTQARMEVMDYGSLHKAVRASSSLAGIHPPTVAENNDLLIDGGGFNNTPADVMRGVVGKHGTVIAVDMGFTKREFPHFNYDDTVSGVSILLNRINPFRRRQIVAPSIVTVMLRANALWSIQATNRQVAPADLILRPPVSDYGLFELDAADAIFQRGYEDARETLAAWVNSGALGDTYARA